MRVGISLMYWPWFTPQEQLALAEQADRLGLHSVWVAEGYGQEAAAMLGLLAGRTDRILLGAGILQIPARQPTTAAMVASTVDRLSGGRMLLGLGLSGPQVSEGWFGVPFTAPLPHGIDRAGRARSDVTVPPLVVGAQEDDLDRARDALRPVLTLYFGGMGAPGENFYVDLAERYGHGRSARACQDAYLAGDKRAAAAALTGELCDLVALVATPGTLGGRLAEYAAAGVDVLVVAPFGDRARLLDALARHDYVPSVPLIA